MKNVFYLSMLLLLSLLMVQCQNSSSTNQDAEVASSDVDSVQNEIIETPEVVDNRKAIFLQGLYATSTASNSKVQYLIDDDSETIWQTRLGAGPDEGLMLSFFEENENYISRLEIDFADQPGLATINDIILYIDGQPLYTFNGDEAISIDTTIKSIFIRIGFTEEISNETFGEEMESRTNASFSSAHAVGLSSIKLFGIDGAEYKIVAPRVVKGSLIPSSNLNPIVAYHAGLLFDGKKEFAWVEGSEGSGRDDSILIKVNNAITITDLQFWNGYQRSPLHYKSNARIKQFTFGKLGESPSIYDLPDDMQVQRIRLDSPLEGENFVLKILDIYPGRSYSDLAISELLLFQGDQPMIIESDLKQQFQDEFLAQSKGTVLEDVLDRRVYCEFQYDEEIFQNNSIILRSDGSFVTYMRDYYPEDDSTMETFADGNWQILEADDKGARIRVFGQLTNLSDLEAYYQGVSKNEFSRIFKDVLELDGSIIEGNRYLGKYYVQ